MISKRGIADHKSAIDRCHFDASDALSVIDSHEAARYALELIVRRIKAGAASEDILFVAEEALRAD